MKLPWGEDEEKKKRIEELEQKVEELEEKRDEFKSRFEAEEERRSELATKKQKAEKRINVLEQRLQTLEEQQKEEEQEEEETIETRALSFQEAHRLLKKLDTVESPEEDLTTIYSPGKISSMDDFKGLKNVITREQLEDIQQHESFIAFLDQDFFHEILKTRPFFKSAWSVDEEFDLGSVLEFIETEKTWVLVSAGETEIYKERAGEFEKVNVFKSRIDKKHSKGGFSQDRFERKREEQVEEHLGEVGAAIKNKRAVYLLGERDLCKRLPGQYLGGFDDNNSLPDEFYKFRLIE